MNTTRPANVDEYISAFPAHVQDILKTLREVIKSVAPEAEEKISYGMPGFKLYGAPLVYFAGYEKHIGFYAVPSGNKAFQNELLEYKTGKGSIQFPLSQPTLWISSRELFNSGRRRI